MRKLFTFLVTMVIAMVANAAEIKLTAVIGEGATSIAALEGKTFAIVNKAEGKALYGSNNQNLAYDVYANAFVNTNSGYKWKLVSLADNADKSVHGYYLLQLVTPTGNDYRYDNQGGVLNSQPTTGWCSFILGLTDKNGQDIKNGAVYDVQYVEGQGFSLKNIGTGKYQGANTRPAEAEAPVYFDFVEEVDFNYIPAVKDLLAEGEAMKANVIDEAAKEAYDAAIADIDPNAITGDGLAEAQKVDAALNALVKYQHAANLDMTRAIVNAEINGAEGWTIERPKGGNGPTLNNASFEYWAGSAKPRNEASFDYYQVITGLPNGIYTVGADMYNSLNGEGGDYTVFSPTCGVYAKVGETEVSKSVDVEGTELKPYTTDQIKVTDGTLRIGVKNFTTPMAARWFVADNFKLTLIDVLPTYTITIADDIENGTVKATPAEAVEGATVTLVIIPAEGYELGTVTVKDAEDNDVAVSEKHTFIMPTTAVTITATFVKTYADVKLTYVDGNDDTADTAYGEVTEALIGYNKIVDGKVDFTNKSRSVNRIGYVKVDASKFNGTITSAKMTAEVSGSTDSKRQTGWGVGYNSSEWSADLTYNTADKSITKVGTEYWTTTTAADVFEPVEFDITEAFAEGNVANILVYELAAAGGTIRNIKVAVEYLPGAPQIANASFEADGAKATSNGPLTITGWTFSEVGNQFNNTELRPANSESKASQFGTSDPSDGEYSLFFRQGWNGNGNVFTITSDALDEIPAGDYMLSVDYKQHYSYDKDEQQNDRTKVSIALINGETTLGSETSPAATGTKGDEITTYFNDTEWSTLTTTFTLAEAIPAGAKVVITLNSAGAKRSDFFLDNVQFVKVPDVELALVDLKKAIEEAEATVPTYPIGDNFFQYAKDEITPLNEAIATAQAAYEAAESKEAVEAATKTLNAFVADFAPKATTPDAEKAYTLSLKTSDEASPFDMSIAEKGITIAEVGTPIYFVAQENGTYALSNGTKYVNYAGGNTWTLSASTEPYGWTIVSVDGGYTIAGKNGFLGTNTSDSNTVGSACYGNKQTSNGNVVWTIEEVSTANMSVKAGKWGTFIAPFDVTIPEGVKAYKVTGVENEQIVKEEVEETIPANTPVVLLNETEEDIEETITGVGLPESETVTKGLLTGIYQAGADIPTGSYVLQTQDGKQAFYHVVETTAIKSVANRCYLTMSAGSAPLRAIFFGSEEGTTGIEAAEATGAEDGILYNLAGQKVDASYKGIVIKKGKVMLKK